MIASLDRIKGIQSCSRLRIVDCLHCNTHSNNFYDCRLNLS